MLNKAKQLIYTAQVIIDLHKKWAPHKGQIKVGYAIFSLMCKIIFLECGRKWGKSEFTIYFLYRFALMNANAACYYIAPFQSQAKELIWANNRLQNFLDKDLRAKYGVKINNSEMRVMFKNGSFIKLDGADNYEKYRGINPHAIAYDEFKDHHPKFHEGMEPNLATYNAPLLIVGTPPEDEQNLYCRMAAECMREDDSAYFNMPSMMNPYNSKTFLEKIKRKLIARGEEDVWEREYLAKRVKGGKHSIFPMFKSPSDEKPHTEHVMPDEVLRNHVRSCPSEWEYYVTYDPGSASCFAVLITALHKETKLVYVLAEIYETDTRKSSTKQIYPKSKAMCMEIWPINYDWFKTYDHAALWFANEVAFEYDEALMPCQKDNGNKEGRLSNMKDMFLEGLIRVSDKCVNFVSEISNYKKDEKGRIPKENDHLIDCFRYFLNRASYNTVPELKQTLEELFGRRFYTPEIDWREHRTSEGLSLPLDQQLLNDLYED